MNVNSFIDDYKFGEYFEKKSIAFLPPHKKVTRAPDRRFGAWDYVVENEDGTQTKYEVKTDRWVRKTGNFFIEIKNNSKKNSGLTTTQSDYYFLIKPTADEKEIDEIYEVPVNLLREFQKCAQEDEFRYSNTGSYGFLLKEKMLLSCST